MNILTYSPIVVLLISTISILASLVKKNQVFAHQYKIAALSYYSNHDRIAHAYVEIKIYQRMSKFNSYTKTISDTVSMHDKKSHEFNSKYMNSCTLL